MQRIDRKTNERLRASAEQLGGGAIYPELDANRYENGSYFADFPDDVDRPATVNPEATELKYESVSPRKEDAASIAARFERLKAGDPDIRKITFEDAIQTSLERSEEYLSAEESYLIAAIRLLIEEHRWGIIPTNVTSANFTADGQGGRFNNALGLVNSLGVSQRLPFGGEVGAAFVVAATDQLDDYLSNTDTQSADIVLEAAIPLLRGAGEVAQESLIQSRRNLIYAAREFEQFRRDYFYDLAADYLTLVVQLQSIANGVRQVERSAAVEARTKALVESGRTEPFQADLATQNTLFALDRLTSQREAYVLSLDRFKRRIGVDIAERVDIDPVQFELPPPRVDPNEALATAFRLRLDLQTEADRVADFNRRVAIARNNQLADLDLILANNLPTDPTRERSGLDFEPGYDEFSARVVFSAPLDRTEEDLELREAQIEAEQALRRYETARDNAAIEVRQAARGIERSQFSLAIQEKNVQASMNRQAAIDAAPDRATARDRTEAVDALRRAQDSLDAAKRDLQLAILRYLNATGQMRIAPNGHLLPPPGMDITETSGPGIIDTSP
ncbi:MAG: TolC family protein [Planctomycetaceae bacterium]|nr:TolC family protein [Planctomycetaceae bacterium]